MALLNVDWTFSVLYLAPSGRRHSSSRRDVLQHWCRRYTANHDAASAVLQQLQAGVATDNRAAGPTRRPTDYNSQQFSVTCSSYRMTGRQLGGADMMSGHRVGAVGVAVRPSVRLTRRHPHCWRRRLLINDTSVRFGSVWFAACRVVSSSLTGTPITIYASKNW